MQPDKDKKLLKYADEHGIAGLTAPSLRALMANEAGYSVEKAKRFLVFQTRINKELLRHRVITHNTFTAWFERGEQSREQVRAFITQFSVFSNLFLVAQLLKTINADSLEGMRASKEILANEIGVVFNSEKKKAKGGEQADYDPDLVSTEGTVEGGQFRFRAAHFEWLMRIAGKLDLTFNDVGKRKHGTKSTLFFCDELARLYGSEDYLTSQAASYAVENWAAAGFWKELIRGFQKFNQRTGDDLPLAFFEWHDRLESQHAAHTQEELEELYFARELNQDKFIKCGNEMLDGVAAFWDGLDDLRREMR